MGILRSLIGNANDRQVNKIRKIVDTINSFEDSTKALSDKGLREKTKEFKERLQNGETLDDILPEAFAVVREGSVRSLGMRHYDVQMIGGIVLHQGRISEMKTGEGKTLVATLPVYLNALEGKGVHVVTVNDYLAKRDMEWMGKLYNFLGLSVGCVIHGIDDEERTQAYNADITYGTNNEFGFDYLRDNMAIYLENRVQRTLNYAIVDEVDSILIDEARTPLIISGEGSKSTDLYQKADSFVKALQNEVDFSLDEKQKTINLTEESGVEKAEKYFNIENLSNPENMEISHHINQALRARFLMKRDVDYVVQDNEVLIVDEFTGRLMQGRRYSNGLHQAIEAKEGLKVMRESQTLATITLQNYFRMYGKISGMTGTAKTEEDEFKHIYTMDVVQIPTNKSIVRKDFDDLIYKSAKGRYNAVIEDIVERHAKGQPVLVGTISIENSELLSSLLKKRGIKHEVLNAKQHDREAEIVAQAGRFGSVTIATNMAGRGTDILLGGNPDFMTKREMERLGYDSYLISLSTSPLDFEEPEINEAKSKYKEYYSKYKETTDAEGQQVIGAGGLHIIGTERHESRRIDNQLRGRAGRQGDPGSTRFYLSFEDDLMRLFVSDKIKAWVSNLGMDDDTPLEASMLTKQIESAQKKVEGKNFAIRKHVLQYDDVMNRQREIIYTERFKVLKGENIKENIIGMLESVIGDNVALYTAEGNYPEEWDMKGLEKSLSQIFLPKDYFSNMDPKELEKFDRESLNQHLKEYALNVYDQKETEIGEEILREIERFVLLKVVDSKWIDHIDEMEDFKQGVNLRAYGNEDPVRAYKIEGFEMFNEMTKNIQIDTVKSMFHATVDTNVERHESVVITGAFGADDSTIGGRIDLDEDEDDGYRPIQPVKKEVTVGRNDPCPCGSGKKYKHCHGKMA